MKLIMKLRKLISGLMCIMIITSNSMCYAMNESSKHDNIKNEIVLELTDNGEFVLEKSKENDKKITVKKINEDIYEVIKDKNLLIKDNKFNKFIKTSSNTYQQVQKIDLDLKNKIEVENILNEYDFPADLEKRLYEKVAKTKEKDDNLGTDVTIYTPRTKKTKDDMNESNSVLTSSVTTSRYYTGYNSQKYLDEILIWDEDTTTPLTLFKGTGTYTKVATVTIEAAKFTAGLTSNIISVATGIVSILSPIVPTKITGRSTDYFNLCVDYRLNTKYTSIYKNVPLYGYVYHPCAVTERVLITYIANDLYQNYNHYKSVKEPYTYVTCKSWSTADKLAYSYKDRGYSFVDSMDYFTVQASNNVIYKIYP